MYLSSLLHMKILRNVPFQRILSMAECLVVATKGKGKNTGTRNIRLSHAMSLNGELEALEVSETNP